MTPVAVLIAGTHGYHDDWWRPGSSFVKQLNEERIRTADSSDPYTWCTKLDGVLGGNEVWESAGHALRWYVRSKVGPYPVSIIAHSHGGQVAAYAAAQGLQIERLITVATPVRGDMDGVYREATKNISWWRHLHSDNDLWQVFGGLMDGRWGIHREMPHADENIMVEGIQHGKFLDPELWSTNYWWEWLR